MSVRLKFNILLQSLKHGLPVLDIASCQISPKGYTHLSLFHGGGQVLIQAPNDQDARNLLGINEELCYVAYYHFVGHFSQQM